VPRAGNEGNVRTNSTTDKPVTDLQASMTSGGGQAGASKSVRNWETLVLFAVSLSQLDVMVNMSNVMGNTVLVSLWCHYDIVFAPVLWNSLPSDLRHVCSSRYSFTCIKLTCL